MAGGWQRPYGTQASSLRFYSYLHANSSLQITSAVDAGIKIRPNEADLREIGPDFERRWKEYFADAQDKPVMWLGPFTA
jgi:hypothetical protein